MKNIEIDELASAITEELKNYSKDVEMDLKTLSKNTAKKCLAEIKKKSPTRPNGGKYKKGWKTTIKTNDDESISIIIHNKVYYLTHLLENGHAKASGGRVEGIPHIAPAEKDAIEDMIDGTKKIVKR